jgi:hypothetical protein
VAAEDLAGERNSLLAVHLHGERGPSIRLESRMGPLGRPFEVMRIVVPAMEDDEILEPAGNEEFAPAEEPQVAGPKEMAGLTHHFSLGFLGFSWKIQEIHMIVRK